MAAHPFWSGFKAEAISAKDADHYVLGTDDESLGSVIRVVPKSELR